MAASIKGTAFWDMSLCSHGEENRRFRDAYCFHHQDDDDRPCNRHDSLIEALLISETSV
jgi:hypothetical protein